MRNWFRYLRWLLVVIILMFVWWAVSVWGGGMTNRRPGDDWAATVNGTSITVPAFQSYARSLDGTYQSLLGDSYAQQRALIHIGQQAINRLIDDELAFQEAVRQGITVTPQEVSESILRNPGFQENGRFIGVERYRKMFNGSRMSVEDYESQVRRDLLVAKFRSLIEDGVTVGDAEVREEFDRRNVKETIDYIVADPAKIRRGAAATDEEVRRYYEAHRDRYTRGEGRTGLYVLYATDAAATGALPSDGEVRAAYDRDRETRFTLKDQRRASHILLKVPADAPPATTAKVEAKAREILKRARSGEDFAALARKYSEDSSASSGGDLNFFSRGQMVKEFEDAAFGLPPGGISDLVRTPYGFHIIKLVETRPGRAVPFEEAREGLRQELQRARARVEAGKRSLDLARAAGGGKLEAVAKSQGLTVSETGPVHDGDSVPGLAGS
ncbi:MAG TPA: peptidylprolyl isomerase, partial [Candidatus Polarisedimenticolia bacterium]